MFIQLYPVVRVLYDWAVAVAGVSGVGCRVSERENEA